MKIEVNEDGVMVLTQVWRGIILETSERNEMSVCMRDDTFELSIMRFGDCTSKRFRVDMQNLNIEPI